MELAVASYINTYIQGERVSLTLACCISGGGSGQGSLLVSAFDS